MRAVTESDVYDKLINKNNAINSKIAEIASNNAATTILNEKLQADFDIMLKVYKSPETLGIINSIKNHEMIVFTADLASSIPSCMPFVKYKKAGKDRVIVNVTAYVAETKDSDTGDIEYHVDVKKLYALCLPAYLTLKLFDKSTSLPPQVIQLSSLMWAKMFNKILNRTIGLTTNKERYEAYMYFAMRFFMMYILQSPEAVADSISNVYLKNGKGYLINFMEERIKQKGINPYESFETFCNTLFDNDISNIKGVRVNNLSETMDYTFYVKKFIETYRYQSVLALASFPYFFFTIHASYRYSDIVSDRAFEDVVLDNSKDMPTLLAGIYKQL